MEYYIYGIPYIWNTIYIEYYIYGILIYTAGMSDVINSISEIFI